MDRSGRRTSTSKRSRASLRRPSSVGSMRLRAWAAGRRFGASESRCHLRRVFCLQAADGIRDHCVTGVQTCALPISNPGDVEHVVNLVREMGCKDHVIVGTERTVVAVIGDDRFKDKSRLESADGVDKVVPILAPYKMASSEVKKERSV